MQPQRCAETFDADTCPAHLRLRPGVRHLSFDREFAARPTPWNLSPRQRGRHVARPHPEAMHTDRGAVLSKVACDNPRQSARWHPMLPQYCRHSRWHRRSRFDYTSRGWLLLALADAYPSCQTKHTPTPPPDRAGQRGRPPSRAARQGQWCG